MRYALGGRRRLLAGLLALCAVTTTAGATPSHAAAAPAARTAGATCDGGATGAVTSSTDTARTVLCLLNRIRSRHDLRPLQDSARLRKAALRHSRDMVRRGFFDHDSPGGGDLVSRARAAGYIRAGVGWTVGENIAWGSGRLATPASIVDAWMHSAGHRHNILSPAFRDLGVGVALGTPRGGGGATYTTDFGALR